MMTTSTDDSSDAVHSGAMLSRPLSTVMTPQHVKDSDIMNVLICYQYIIQGKRHTIHHGISSVTTSCDHQLSTDN